MYTGTACRCKDKDTVAGKFPRRDTGHAAVDRTCLRSTRLAPLGDMD